MSLKKTPWLSGSVKPVHVGVYETTCSYTNGALTYQHWNGFVWGRWAPTPDKAETYACDQSRRQSPEWRGLAENPEAP